MIEAIQPGTELILVRHGETVENVTGIAQGWKDGTLSELGTQQVAKLAWPVAKTGQHTRPQLDTGEANGGDVLDGPFVLATPGNRGVSEANCVRFRQ